VYHQIKLNWVQFFFQGYKKNVGYETLPMKSVHVVLTMKIAPICMQGQPLPTF